MPTPRTAPTVLVIDDDLAIRSLFATALELGGYASIEAATAEAGLRLIEAGLRPDAVLLDIQMPGMGGMGFLLQLRADPRRRQIPIAIVTGYEPMELVQQTAELFGVGVYRKPLLPEELLEITGLLVSKNIH